ncbi:MAG: cytochrome c oxidase subunit 3 [Sphingomonadales bacterium]|nr:cytochrome c oxidase subunit 3 [Sphingomonadales bacterium]
MNGERALRRVGDLAGLPTSAQGPRNLVWWGNISFMAIEGTGFALAIGACLYLLGQSPHWPPPGDSLPGLGWSGAFTLALVLSELPNLWLIRQVRAKSIARVRLGMLVMTLIGIALIGLRWFELQHLNVGWDHDAYGSTVWMLMVLHTSHVVTELVETAVLTVWLYTHEVGDDQLGDVEDDADYWTFVILAWVPIYLLVYWVPRWL